MPKFERLTAKQAKHYERKERMSTQETSLTQNLAEFARQVEDAATSLGIKLSNVNYSARRSYPNRCFSLSMDGETIRPIGRPRKAQEAKAQVDGRHKREMPVTRPQRNRDPDRACVVCGHRWVSRSQQPPTACPFCHSTLWKGAKGSAVHVKVACG